MIFNVHSEYTGKHAFLSASNPAWVNYDEEKLERTWHTSQEARRGTRLHLLAHELIDLGIPLEDNGKTLNSYVRDGIGYRMETEKQLVYSPDIFGTADSICFRDNTLRIHDLKTGASIASMTQLEIYAALFCLEYKYDPFAINILLYIYQNDAIKGGEADYGSIVHIMDKAKVFNQRIMEMRMEEL